MVKLRKFFYYFFVLVFIILTAVPLVSCESNELEKVSKKLTTYAIDAVVSDDKTITASENVTYVNTTGKKLSKIYFHLYPRAFRQDASFKPYTSLTLDSCFPSGISYGDIEILSASAGGQKVEFALVGSDEDILEIPLNQELSSGSKIDILIDFNLTIPCCTHRLGYYEKNINLGNWYPVVCPFIGGDFDKSPYYSTGDPFCSEIANYNVKIAYPSQYLLSSTGTEISSNNGAQKVSTITAKAVRDFAVNLSEDTAKISKQVGKIRVCYVGYKSDENFEKYLDVSARAIEFFNRIFGVYPYEIITVVKMPFIYGGMEYPNIVFVSDSVTEESEKLKVIVHEIAHQWWYGVVGNNEITEAWLDESLAEYSVALFFKNNPEFEIKYDDLVKDAISSYMLYVDVIKTIRGEVNTKMNLPVNEYQNDYEYSYMVYIKGVIMFDELSKTVGDKKVIDGLKKYYKDNKFKIATKDDFYKAFSSACHKDLKNFFDGYLYGTTIISKIN